MLSNYSMEKNNYHTLITYMLPHDNMWHLFNNMLSTWLLGSSIESYFSSKTLFAVYLGGGLLGGLFIS